MHVSLSSVPVNVADDGTILLEYPYENQSIPKLMAELQEEDEMLRHLRLPALGCVPLSLPL
jgi:hypothetical protein